MLPWPVPLLTMIYKHTCILFHTQVSGLGTHLKNPFAYEPVRWLSWQKHLLPSLSSNPVDTTEGKNQLSQVVLCPLPYTPMKIIKSVNSPACQFFFSIRRAPIHPSGQRSSLLQSSVGFQVSSHAFLAVPSGYFLTSLGPEPALVSTRKHRVSWFSL